jgi:hypothetical protein
MGTAFVPMDSNFQYNVLVQNWGEVVIGATDIVIEDGPLDDTYSADGRDIVYWHDALVQQTDMVTGAVLASTTIRVPAIYTRFKGYVNEILWANLAAGSCVDVSTGEVIYLIYRTEGRDAGGTNNTVNECAAFLRQSDEGIAPRNWSTFTIAANSGRDPSLENRAGMVQCYDGGESFYLLTTGLTASDYRWYKCSITGTTITISDHGTIAWTPTNWIRSWAAGSTDLDFDRPHSVAANGRTSAAGYYAAMNFFEINQTTKVWSILCTVGWTLDTRCDGLVLASAPTACMPLTESAIVRYSAMQTLGHRTALT